MKTESAEQLAGPQQRGGVVHLWKDRAEFIAIELAPTLGSPKMLLPKLSITLTDSLKHTQVSAVTVDLPLMPTMPMPLGI